MKKYNQFFFLGDFKVGGYAWEVKDMQQLDDVIPAKGSLNYGSILYDG
ncbi:hypothetical protein [Peribacillus simplex]|nr:hypothetical protein [Peribacillus simplex]